MQQQTMLSIICLSWNHEKYIEQALNSIINQTYKNFEIIYLDNASTDKSYQIAIEILNKSNVQFKVKRFVENIGAVKAINFALKNLIRSQYISMLAMDDWLDIENYSLKIDYATKNPQYGIIYSRGHYFIETTKEYIRIPMNGNNEGWVFNELLKSNFLFMMGALIKKEVYDTIGYYDEETSIEDWDFGLRASQKFEIGLINKPLFYYRKHDNNYTKGSHVFFQDCFKVINKYKKFPNFKIGYTLIKNSYLGYMLGIKFSFKNLFYILKYIPYNKLNCKILLKYLVFSIKKSSKQNFI